MEIKYNTERFETLGDCIKFLKKSKHNNYHNNKGINILSDFEVHNIIQYLEFCLSENERNDTID